jgi:hypothetical protein
MKNIYVGRTYFVSDLNSSYIDHVSYALLTDCKCFVLMLPPPDSDQVGCFTFPQLVRTFFLIPTLPDADYISHAARPQSVYLFQRSLSLMPTESDASPPTARMYFDALLV